MSIARYYNEDNNPHGAAIPGVPLRDLTQEEYDALPDMEKASVDASELYRKTKPASAKAKPAAEDKEG